LRPGPNFEIYKGYYRVRRVRLIPIAPLCIDMKEVEEGDHYVWDHDIRGNVTVTVTDVTSGGVMVKITDSDVIEESIRVAEKTYQDNGRDRDNVKEVCPFVKFEENEIVADKEQFIITAGTCNEFEEKFKRASNVM